MFKNLFSTKPAAAPVTDNGITDEKLAEVVAILNTVGLAEGDPYGFRHHVRKDDNFWGGSFEWTERGAGTRFLTYRNYEGRVSRVQVVKHGYTSHDADKIAQVNEALEAVFAQ